MQTLAITSVTTTHRSQEALNAVVRIAARAGFEVEVTVKHGWLGDTARCVVSLPARPTDTQRRALTAYAKALGLVA